MKIVFWITAFLLCATSVFADEKTEKTDSVSISGEVYDSFTGLPVEAFLTLIHGDSTIMDTMTCHKRKEWDKDAYVTYYRFRIPKGMTDLKIRATHPQYEEQITPIKISPKIKSNWADGPEIVMKRSIYKNVDLDGVTVTGTRVQMVYRGDTIVYDAAAFALPEGSMLDGLVRQLPGAELKPNGDIYINGEKIDYLTLNGKDFFKGDNKVMLENLPYFTVKDLKVYHKKSDKEEALGIKEAKKRDYVMDVELKREYSTGHIVNAEVGVGTENRWLAKLFALGYGERARYSVFGNINNVNEERSPGQDGNWDPSKTEQGLVTTKQVGAHYENSDAGKKWEEQFDAKMMWTETENETKNNSVTFSTDGDIYGGRYSATNSNDKRLDVSNRFRWRKPVYIESNIRFNYNDSHTHSVSLDSTYRSQIINQSSDLTLGKSRSWSLDLNVHSDHQVSNGDYYFYTLTGTLSRQTPYQISSLRLTHFENLPDDDRNTFDDQKNLTYSFGATGGYSYNLGNDYSILGMAGYSQNYYDRTDYYYRLDRLKGRYEHEIGMLPSTQDSLLLALDKDNSTDMGNLTRTVQFGPMLSRNTESGYLQFYSSFTWNFENLSYKKSTLDTIARRTTFQPYAMFSYSSWKGKFPRSMSYTFYVNNPSLTSLMPVMSNTNPLYTFINNPDLKSSLVHDFSFSQELRLDSVRLSLWAGVRANITQRATGTRTIYNSLTGAYTTMSDNVDGNWNGTFSYGGSYYFDKKRLFSLNLNGSVGYNHSVDFNVLNITAPTVQFSDELSKVNTWTSSAKLTLGYRKGTTGFGLVGKLDNRRSRSNQPTFVNVDTHDFQYGANATFQIPWVKVDLSTDINMYSRRGYQSSVMNTDDLVWNAQLSKTLLKGKLTLKAQGFDILKQVNTVQYNINAQGRTEMWFNSIPRYFLFSVACKLTKTPKKG